MKAAAEAIWKDKLTSLPPIAGKSCSEIVTQWSREEGILPPDAKKLINQHFFTVTEDDGDQHIEAKLTAWFWQFVAQNYANKKSITVPQLRLCCKAFEMNTATGSTKTQLAHAAIGCIWMFLRLDSDSPYKFQDKKAQALMKAVEAEFNNKNESTTPKKQKSTATSSPAKEIGTSTEPTLPPTEEAATTLAQDTNPPGEKESTPSTPPTDLETSNNSGKQEVEQEIVLPKEKPGEKPRPRINKKDIVIVSAVEEPENFYHIENYIWPAVVVSSPPISQDDDTEFTVQYFNFYVGVGNEDKLLYITGSQTTKIKPPQLFDFHPLEEDEVKILSTSQSTGFPTVIEMRPGLFVALVKQIELEEKEPKTDEDLVADYRRTKSHKFADDEYKMLQQKSIQLQLKPLHSEKQPAQLTRKYNAWRKEAEEQELAEEEATKNKKNKKQLESESSSESEPEEEQELKPVTSTKKRSSIKHQKKELKKTKKQQQDATALALLQRNADVLTAADDSEHVISRENANRFRREFLEVLKPSKPANTYVGIKKSLATCNTQPKQGHIVGSLISGFLPDWKHEIEEPHNTISIKDWQGRAEFPLLVSYIASEFQNVYNLFHYIPTHNLTTLSGITSQLRSYMVQHKPKQGNSTTQGFGHGEKNPQQQRRLAKEALKQKADEVHTKFQSKNLSLRDNFMEIQKNLKADMEAQVKQLQDQATTTKKEHTLRLLKQEAAKVDSMIVSTRGIAAEVMDEMVEKKTELQIKMWMLEEDEDCTGMSLEELDQEYQKRKVAEPQPTESSTPTTPTSTIANTTNQNSN
jgi:hypothetical protein